MQVEEDEQEEQQPDETATPCDGDLTEFLLLAVAKAPAMLHDMMEVCAAESNEAVSNCWQGYELRLHGRLPCREFGRPVAASKLRSRRQRY